MPKMLRSRFCPAVVLFVTLQPGSGANIFRHYVGSGECLTTEWLKIDPRTVEPASDALDDAPLPDGRLIETGTRGQPPCSVSRIAAE